MRQWLLVHAAALLTAAALGADDAPAPPAFTVTHFPTEAYVGEPVTFAFAGAPDAVVTATLEGQPLARAPLTGARLELTLRFAAAGHLRLTQGATTHVFHLVLPGDPVRLRVDHGFLFSASGPVVLLLPHRHPPRQDRTWEAAKVLASLVGPDPRPAIRSVALVGAGYLAADAPAPLAARGWTWYAPGDTGGELAAALAAVPDLKPADALVLALGTADLEQGLSLLSCRQRVEWFLQAVDRHRFPRVFVVAPLFDRFGRERFPDVLGHLRLAAGGNRASLVVPTADPGRPPLAAADWLPLVTPGLGAEVRLP